MALWIELAVLIAAGALSVWYGTAGAPQRLPFWQYTGGLLLATAVIVWIGYAPTGVALRIREALGRQVPLPTREEDPEDLYTRTFPAKLEWNWGGFVLGPFWYLIQGLWVHGTILLALEFVTGGLFLPLVHVYSGLKANEDLLEFRIAQRSVY